MADSQLSDDARVEREKYSVMAGSSNQLENSMWMRTCRNAIIWLTILLVGVVFRIYRFGIAPGNGAMHKDEAYAAYEAWSILNYGMDSHGYHFPVYLSAWDSGMNAMESYLMIPFIKLWGLNNVTARLPQVIVAIVSLPAFYLFVRRLINKKAAYISMAVLSVVPWHIMMARWGLESNLFPSFFLFGLVCLLYSEDHPQLLVGTGVLWGLSLYCYSAAWVIMPFLVAFITGYFIRAGRVKSCGYLVVGGVILALLAFPLILFLLVNMAIIPEIKTSCFSVPRMYSFRGNEVSLSNIKANLIRFLDIFTTQENGRLNEQIPEYGIYYKFSNVFILLGIGTSISALLDRKKTESRKDVHIIMLVWLSCAVVLGLLVEINYVRINVIHYVLVFYCSYGIFIIYERFGKNVLVATGLAYLSMSLLFFSEYVGDYTTDTTDVLWGGGTREALAFIEDKLADQMCHVYDVTPSQLFYYEQIPTDYVSGLFDKSGSRSESAAWKQIGHYEFESNVLNQIDAKEVYLYSKDNWNVTELCKETGMITLDFDSMRVSYNAAD